MQLGVIGLGTMGANLARNAARNGASVALYNRTTERTEAFMKAYSKEGDFIPCKTLRDFVKVLKAPRAILFMVKAGAAVDEVIHDLLSLPPTTYHLQPGDSLIDGGNSHYRDTERRIRELKGLLPTTYSPPPGGVHFVGMGISGGEKGALEGPSLMPGGDLEAYDELETLLKKMAADDGDGGKCVTYIGPGGAGHFVKMVHNGIEYGLMQLIAESYDLLKSKGHLTNEELAQTFAAWGRGAILRSFLLEITTKILRKRDAGTGNYLIDSIKDSAAQKGTGKWTTEAAMHYGIAIPTINAAVDARILSGSLDQRRRRKDLPEALERLSLERKELVDAVRSALALSTICTYAQGFELLERVSTEEHWDLSLQEVARIWQGGCIIRSSFLSTLQAAYAGNSTKAKVAKKAILQHFHGERQLAWRRALKIGLSGGIPLPAMSASLHYYDTLRREHLPQNLTQAQRDFFGAHTYERIDKPGSFHTEWN